MRERGLKLLMKIELKKKSRVAPHAGAWIETINICIYIYCCIVAPHAGAWIETIYPYLKLSIYVVAPHAGAWIETKIHQS